MTKRQFLGENLRTIKAAMTALHLSYKQMA